MNLRAAAIILIVASLSCGALIHAVADEPEDDPDDAVQSKMYVRQLRQFGGRASVLFDELSRGFAGLWRGKTLGTTIACLGTAAGIALYVLWRSPAGGPLPPRTDRSANGEKPARASREREIPD